MSSETPARATPATAPGIPGLAADRPTSKAAR